MRVLTLLVLLAATAPAVGAPTPKEKAKAEAAAALALAASCDCPAGERPKCGDVAEVLAKVSAEIAEEATRPAVAPAPRPKDAAPKCDCNGGECVGLCPGCQCKPAPASPAVAPAVAPAAMEFTDANGCRWVGTVGADGRTVYTRVSCPLRR